MDFLSLGAGFLGGVLGGTLSNYLADRFTDTRRDRKRAREQTKLWQDIENRFPAVIAEMRADFSRPDQRHVRAFFVKDSKTHIGRTSEPSFEYDTDKHPNLTGAVSHLQKHGFITRISPDHATPMYRMHEHLVDRLVN